MSRNTFGVTAVGLLSLVLLVGCEQSDNAAAEPAPAGAPAATAADAPPEKTEEQLAKETQELLQQRLGAIDERLEKLEDTASGPHEDRVDALAERRKEIADRIDRLADEAGTATYDPQAIEVELQQLDEDMAVMEREILPDGGEVGVDSPAAAGG